MAISMYFEYRLALEQSWKLELAPIRLCHHPLVFFYHANSGLSLHNAALSKDQGRRDAHAFLSTVCDPAMKHVRSSANLKTCD